MKPMISGSFVIKRQKPSEETMYPSIQHSRKSHYHRRPEIQVFHAEQPVPSPVATKEPWLNPMPNFSWSVPAGRYNERAFGYRGTKSFGGFGINTGVFLESALGTQVNLVEDGYILAIRDYRWNQKNMDRQRLKSVFVEGKTGVVIYSGLFIDADLKVGMVLNAGESIGTLGCSHLKLELTDFGTKSHIFWNPAQEKPKSLMDPTNYLLAQITGKTR